MLCKPRYTYRGTGQVRDPGTGQSHERGGVMRGKIDFLKMHGAGNDFVVIEDLEGRLVPTPGLVTALCAYHRGIGADGMILICSGKQADFRMRYFNSNGGDLSA